MMYIVYIVYIYICVHISSQWMISNVRSYKALGISVAYATYIQRFLGRFIDVSLFYGPFPLLVECLQSWKMMVRWRGGLLYEIQCEGDGETSCAMWISLLQAFWPTIYHACYELSHGKYDTWSVFFASLSGESFWHINKVTNLFSGFYAGIPARISRVLPGP